MNTLNIKEQLNYEANTIEDIANNFGIDLKVTSCIAANTIFRYKLLLPKGVKIKKIEELSKEFAMGIGKNSIRFTNNKDGFFIETTSNQHNSNRLLDLLRSIKNAPKLCALLGKDTEGEPIFLRINSPETVGILVTSASGGGKTVLTRSIIVSLCYYNSPKDFRVLLIDPKSKGMVPLLNLPHVLKNKVFTDGQEIIKVLNDMILEMEKRDKSGHNNHPLILICIDELADLVLQYGDEILNPLTRISQRGRESKVQLLLVTQKATTDIVGKIAKANLNVKLVGRVTNKNEAQIATGIAGSGAERLSGRGDFLLCMGGNVERFNAAFLDSNDYVKILNKIQGVK